jgi:hypothetical protein
MPRVEPRLFFSLQRVPILSTVYPLNITLEIKSRRLQILVTLPSSHGKHIGSGQGVCTRNLYSVHAKTGSTPQHQVLDLFQRTRFRAVLH